MNQVSFPFPFNAIADDSMRYGIIALIRNDYRFFVENDPYPYPHYKPYVENFKANFKKICVIAPEAGDKVIRVIFKSPLFDKISSESLKNNLIPEYDLTYGYNCEPRLKRI